MDYRKSLAAAALAVGTLVAAPAFADISLVTNGGFETGDFTGWSASVDPNYSGVDTVSAHSGNFGAYFGDFGTSGSISQTFSTVAGAHYAIQLWLRSDGLTPNSLEVLWGGATVYAATNFGLSAYTGIMIDSLATGTSTTLQLRVRNDSGFLEMDDISVTAVPEPSRLALLCAGLLGLIWLRQKTA